LRVLTLLLVSEELGIKLDVNDWVLVAIHLGELEWVATAHLVFFWVVPCSSLGKRGGNLFENLSLNHKSLYNMKIGLWGHSTFKLELNGMC